MYIGPIAKLGVLLVDIAGNGAGHTAGTSSLFQAGNGLDGYGVTGL